MKNWSLRTKVLLSVGVIIFLALGISTIVQTRFLQNDYFQSVEWRSEALAQSIVNEIVDMYAYTPYNRPMLSTLSLRCQQIYETDKEKSVTHVAIIDNEGLIAAHNERSQLDTPITSPAILNVLDHQQQATVLEGDVFHTLVPVFGTTENIYLGSVDIGFAKEAFDQKRNAILVNSALVFFLFAVLTMVSFSVLMNRLLTTPVKTLVNAGQALAAGNLSQSFKVGNGQDEIATLGSVFTQIARYLQHIAEVATHISTGILDGKIRIRSEQDILGKAVQEMLHYLRYIESVASQIAEGDLTKTVQLRSAEDAFGKSIQAMMEGLRSLILQIRASADQIESTQRSISSLSSHDMAIVRDVHQLAESAMNTLQELGSSVEEVAHNMDLLSVSVTETSASVSQMTSSIGHIASHTTDLTDQTQQTINYLDRASNALKDVVENTDISQQLSQETMQDALAGQEAVEQVTNSMETIHTTIMTAVESITQFAARSQDIDRILEVIQRITDQTNLLALNASIIAAQAGVHGRGFAVVADEIRNLATGVGTSTKDIASIVNTLRTDTAKVVKTIHEGAEDVEQGMQRTQQARETLQKILKSAERSSNVVTDINTTLHGLMGASQDVSMSMDQVTTMTDDITASISEHEASTRQINQAIGHVNEMASQIQRATTEQLSGIQHIIQVMQDVSHQIDSNLQSSQNITASSEELTLQARLLLESIDQFKVSL